MVEAKKAVLIIIDGFGYSEKKQGNAITLASTPNWDQMLSKYPWTLLEASGNAVGLPDGVMGNSEVGHLTIGSGRIEFQSFEKINQAIKNKKLGKNERLQDLITKSGTKNGVVHLMGLTSFGGVHSHYSHLIALLDVLSQSPKIKKIYVHAFTDGRDVSPHSSVKDISKLLEDLNNSDKAVLSDIVGRFYAMDRDKRWERTKVAYDMLTQPRSPDQIVSNPIKEIKKRYESGETDEFLKPILLTDEGIVRDGDTILFFNFRPDRARQLSQFFLFPERFKEYGAKKIDNLDYYTMTEYDPEFPATVLFPEEKLNMTLAEYCSKLGLKQIHIAETEKYAHVTYFLNGGWEEPFPNEDRVLVPSKRNFPTYDLIPEMSTKEISEEVIKAMNSDPNYSLIVCNFASPDMVGHTGNLDATIKAVEILDEVLGNVLQEAQSKGYTLFITADHGNAEKMVDENGNPFTAHTTNKVPFLVTDTDISLSPGGLSDVAPTLLHFCGLPKPPEMTGKSLIVHQPNLSLKNKLS
ncbi:MAG: 2,3-bisphosphoglycerate-independent phosphoglycerate mutase [Methanobacteriota archaeon]|nr:MAG: 2,3-bisphosphoglycerate-independent phosphoglycerate mutase [Euryarchaeota archaeon]